MNPVEEQLFDAYAAPILNELCRFPDKAVEEFLDGLPIGKSRRIELYDQARHLYFQWSADAFAVGLHLGLSLLHHDIRRLRPEER